MGLSIGLSSAELHASSAASHSYPQTNQYLGGIAVIGPAMMTVKREVCLIHGAINGVEVSFGLTRCEEPTYKT